MASKAGRKLAEGEAARVGAGEQHVRLHGRVGEVRAVVGRAQDADAGALDQRVDPFAHRDGDGDLTLEPAAHGEVDEQEQRLVVRHTVAQLVEEEDALAGRVEDHPQVGAGGRDEALDGPASAVAGRRTLDERVQADHLDASLPEDRREDRRPRRVAVVDDAAEAAPGQRLAIDGGHELLDVALEGADRECQRRPSRRSSSAGTPGACRTARCRAARRRRRAPRSARGRGSRSSPARPARRARGSRRPAVEERISCRLSEGAATRRSATCTPVAIRPEISGPRDHARGRVAVAG